jgi:superfamily I DNA/RNA helicase
LVTIYSFRAATVRNILDFPDQFSPRAKIVTLDRNYRSTRPILAAANGVIGLAKERFTKNLWTERLSSQKPQLVAVRDEADQARYVVEQVLAKLTLDPPDATSDQAGVPLLDEDYLILSTIHSAKGQEWKSVLVLNVVDGCIPSDLGAGTTEELEEERRLLYVAMTRAKDDLHLIIPQRFFVYGQSVNGDRHLYASRTRFIPVGLLPLFERSSWPVTAETVGRVAIKGPRIDITKRMRERWR